MTAANLENFVKIHHNIEQHHRTRIEEEEDFQGVVPPNVARGTYSSNIIMHATKTLDKKWVPPMSDDMTIDIPPDVFHVGARTLGKTKDFDTVSMASSTHFTVVNGIGRQPKVPKSGLCDRGKQITVLIVTMSIIFMIGIIAAVYFMESKYFLMLLFFQEFFQVLIKLISIFCCFSASYENVPTINARKFLNLLSNAFLVYELQTPNLTSNNLITIFKLTYLIKRKKITDHSCIYIAVIMH